MDDTLTPTSMRSSRRRDDVEHAGRAGLLAALVMLAVQLIWRLELVEGRGRPGVPRVHRRRDCPGSHRSRSSARRPRTTEVSPRRRSSRRCLVGIVAIGLPLRDGRRLAQPRIGRGAAGRVIAGLVVAAALWLVTLVVVMPIAHLGSFARESSYTSDILTQLTVTFASSACSGRCFARPAEAAGRQRGASWSPAEPAGAGAWGVGTLVATITVDGRDLAVGEPAQATAIGTTHDRHRSQSSADDIVATSGRFKASIPTRAHRRDTPGVGGVAAMDETRARRGHDRYSRSSTTAGKISPVLTEVTISITSRRTSRIRPLAAKAGRSRCRDRSTLRSSSPTTRSWPRRRHSRSPR